MTEPVPYLDLPAQLRAIRAEIDAAIARTIDNCSFCLGPDVAQFEKDFAKFCGAEHCVALQQRHLGAARRDAAARRRAGRRSHHHAVHVRRHELGDFLRRRQAGLRGH